MRFTFSNIQIKFVPLNYLHIEKYNFQKSLFYNNKSELYLNFEYCKILAYWDQVEKIFWFNNCFIFKKGEMPPVPSSKPCKLMPKFLIQLSLRCSFYCTSYSKGSIVPNTFNFGTKALITRLVIDDVTVVNMWFYESFIDS